MRVIHKHEVGPGVFTLELPEDAQILDVQEQYDRPTLWVLGDPQGRQVKRWVRGIETGDPAPHDSWQGWRYIGTCQLYGGTYVLHFFVEES